MTPMTLLYTRDTLLSLQLTTPTYTDGIPFRISSFFPSLFSLLSSPPKPNRLFL